MSKPTRRVGRGGAAQLHKAHGALATLFIRGRHANWVSSQKLRLISAALRVNMQFQLSFLLLKDKLRRMYDQAAREPYSFLFVYSLKPKNQMLYKRFEEFVLEKDAEELPGLEAVRQLQRCCTSVEIADSFLSTDRGRCLDAEPESAPAGRLASPTTATG